MFFEKLEAVVGRDTVINPLWRTVVARQKVARAIVFPLVVGNGTDDENIGADCAVTVTTTVTNTDAVT